MTLNAWAFMNGEVSNYGNYRLIRLTDHTVEKLFDEIVHSQLCKYKDANNIRDNRQLGFRKAHSTHQFAFYCF